MKIMNELRISLLLLLLLIFAGCGRGSEAGDVEEIQVQEEKRIPVAVRSLGTETLSETFTLPGSLEAWEDLTLAAELAGPVRETAREGGRLKKGEVILRIDPETQQAEYDRVLANYRLQEKNLERLEKLVESKFVSQREYDDALRGFEAARAELTRVRVALDKSVLKSPVDGVLDRLMTDRGEFVSVGDPVAVVVQVDRLKVLMEVPEKDISFLHVGDDVGVVPAALEGKTAERIIGEIIHLAYKADPVTRTYLAKIAVDNGEGNLRPGMIVRVHLDRRKLKDVITVPLYALVDRSAGKVVFIEENGVARMRQVRIGSVVGERAVILEGLRQGDRLIIKGQHLLSDGSSVAVEES